MASFSGLLPLIILLVVVGVGGFVGYSLYTWSNELAERATKKMEKKNMAFTKEGGLRVGVKEMKTESYADKTQNVLVNVWNHADLPNYKSRFGWNSTQSPSAAPGHGSPSPRPASSRPSGSAANTTQSTAGASTLAPPEHRAQRRSASPVPGSWD